MKQPLRVSRTRRRRDLGVVASARAVGVLGHEIALVALVLHVHDHGGGPRGVTALLVSAAAPTVLLAPWAGRLVDRVDSRRLAVGSALLSGAACLALASAPPLWVLCALVVVLQLGQAVAIPTWTALVPRIAGDAGAARALGSVQALTTCAGAAGPAVGGLLVAAGGVRTPLLVDAVSFAVVAGAAGLVRTRRGAAPESAAAGARALDGLRTLRADAVVWPLLLGLLVFVVVGEVTNIVEVFLVRDVLGGDATAYGLVGAAAAGGLVLGSLLAGRIVDEGRRVRCVLVAQVIWASMTVVGGVVPTVPAFVVAWAALGLANGALNVSIFALLLTRTPETRRGQVLATAMGLGRACGIAALLLGGVAGGLAGPRSIFLGAGAVAVVVAVAVALVALSGGGSRGRPRPPAGRRERRPGAAPARGR